MKERLLLLPLVLPSTLCNIEKGNKKVDSLILHPPTASFELMKLTKKERRRRVEQLEERRARAVFSIFHSLGSCQNYAATR